MNLWQRAMIRLARSGRAKRVMGRLAAATPLERRFIGGESAAAAVATARRLREEHGISSSLFYLGEYVSDPVRVERNVQAALEAMGALATAGLDVHVSVDPTAIGQMSSPDLCGRNAERLARAVRDSGAAGRGFLMLDMEDLSLVDPTLALHARLLAQRLPAAVTLQARLRRTEADLSALLGTARAIRLVKGAFPLGPAHDHQGGEAIGRSYMTLAESMLSVRARRSGFYPVFATHDDVLARRIAVAADANGWRPGEYEFEMLYGVRPEWQRALRSQGHAVRVYLPFGDDWWPYAVRRVGENPRNVLLLARALLGR